MGRRFFQVGVLLEEDGDDSTTHELDGEKW